MSTRKIVRWRSRTANTFGVLGYLSVTIQWVIAAALFVPLLKLIPSPERQPTPEAVDPTQAVVDTGSQILMYVIIIVVTAAILGITFVVMAKLPMTIARVGKKAVHQSSDALTHVILRAAHKKETKKRRLALLPKVVLSLKLVAVLLPVTLAYVSYALPEKALDPLLAVHSSAVLADVSIALFTLQLLAARWLRVTPTDLW